MPKHLEALIAGQVFSIRKKIAYSHRKTKFEN